MPHKPEAVNGAKLTEPQRRELGRLAKEPQPTFGAGRARVQNNLRALGLAEYLNADGTVWKPTSALDVICGRTYDKCRITDAGREALKLRAERQA